MYGNNYMVDNLNRQKERIEDMIRNYQQPVNNFINASQTPSKDMVEWRILNENEEVDNLYVPNNTLFIGDDLMIKKSVDGTLEKWNIKKVYPIDKKDEKINMLEEKIKELEARLNEPTKSNEPIRECDKSNVNVDGNVESKPKTTSKSVSK